MSPLSRTLSDWAVGGALKVPCSLLVTNSLQLGVALTGIRRSENLKFCQEEIRNGY